MKKETEFEVILIGGSYAGLSAAMALGRSLRKVLVIDSGKPCNRQTPHSHNFLTQDGEIPNEISKIAKEQVQEYPTVKFYAGLVTNGKKTEDGFQISTRNNDTFTSKKVIFATGIKDIMPKIKGFSECWGISIIHCPYCHGYEYRNQKTGIFGNGNYGFEFSKTISNWTDDLTLFTNGKSELDNEQTKKLIKNNIPIIEKEIAGFENVNGHLQHIVFRNGEKHPMKAVYAQLPFVQHCDLPMQLGCELDENGYIKADMFQHTNVNGLFACGDCTTFLRSIANGVATGTVAGAMANKALIEERFV